MNPLHSKTTEASVPAKAATGSCLSFLRASEGSEAGAQLVVSRKPYLQATRFMPCSNTGIDQETSP